LKEKRRGILEIRGYNSGILEIRGRGSGWLI